MPHRRNMEREDEINEIETRLKKKKNKVRIDPKTINREESTGAIIRQVPKVPGHNFPDRPSKNEKILL